jgi:sigma-B regulation protein RsbU (phosphoserine phosphatase)
MRAALVTAIMRGLVEELMPIAHEGGEFLSDINQSLLAIFQRTDQPMLATAIYVILDVARGEMRLCSAGHPSPVHVSRKLGRAEKLSCHDRRHGPALGLFENSVFPVCTFPLAEKDLILFFTDGLYEVNGPDQEEYGQDRLLHAIQKRVHLPPEQLFDELLAEVQDFSLHKEFEDDVCLVAAEVAHLESP